MVYLRFTPLVLLASCLAATPALSQSAKQIFLPQGPVADAPAGFTQMCARDRDLCLLGQSDEMLEVIKVSATYTGPQVAPDGLDLRAMIKAVNRDVNRHVIQRTDIESVGAGEYWRRLPADQPVGDCEDIAIEKRIRLMEAGFPAERLFYGVAFVRNIGLHTVLIARMEEGDFVLDSLTPRIERWQDTHYFWLRKQMPGSPLQWQRIDNHPIGTTLASAASEGEGRPAS